MQKKYRALAVFLIVFTGFMTVYIGTQIYGIFLAERNESTTTAKPSVDCIALSYKVNNVEYDGYELSFDLRNNDDSIENIRGVMVHGVNERFVEIENFLPGLERQVVISDIEVVDNFTVYPDNCKSYSRTCNLETKECVNIIG